LIMIVTENQRVLWRFGHKKEADNLQNWWHENEH
jgi:hypothetical protein